MPITGYDAKVALEAAHLRPYRGPESNTVTNGLLLRQIAVSKLLTGTHYGSLVTRTLAEPAENGHRPGQEVLDELWQHFTDAEDGR